MKQFVYFSVLTWGILTHPYQSQQQFVQQQQMQQSQPIQLNHPDPETLYVLNHAAGVASGFAGILSDPNNPHNVSSNILNMAGHVIDIFFTVARQYLPDNASLHDVEEWLINLSEEEKTQLRDQIIRGMEKRFDLNL